MKMTSGTAWQIMLIAGAILTIASCGKESPRVERTAAADDTARAAFPLPLPAAPGGGIIIEKNVMIPMRDGIRLATDVYRPAGKDKYPVVFVRTPYGTEIPEAARQGEFYVLR